MNYNSIISIMPKIAAPAYDADAQLFFNAQSAAGVTLTTTQKNAVNQLVVDSKSAGIWTKMKAIYPLVGGTATSHKFNLLNPADTNAAFRLVFSGGLTHSSDGILGGGVNGWANTFLTPSTSLTLNNSHISYNIYTNAITAPIAHIGARSASNAAIWAGISTTANESSYNGTSTNVVSKSITASTHKGFWCGSRTANNSHNFIGADGVINSNTTTVTAVLPTLAFPLLGLNIGTISQYSNFGYSFFSIGDGLTTTEMTAFKTAVNNFQTTLGRI